MKRCPLYVSRLKSMATEMFKSMTHKSPTFIESLLLCQIPGMIYVEAKL